MIDVLRLDGAVYGHDDIGQLTSTQAFEPRGGLRLNENLGYAYDASGNLAWRTNNDFLQAFTCDASDELVNITRSGALTAAGSVTGAVTQLGINGTLAQIYSDGTFATTNGLTLRDGITLFVSAGTNAAGQLAVSTVTANPMPVSVNLIYDMDGNLTSDGQRVFAYDDADRLVSVTVANSYRTEFVYDGLSRRRIVREYGWRSGWNLSSETRNLYDGLLPLQERDANNNVLVTYTHGLDLSGTFASAGGIGGYLARTDSNGSAFYHSDLAGNVTTMADGLGYVVASYVYDSFGRIVGMRGPLASANSVRFSSMLFSDRAAIAAFYSRFYDPSLQRWLNEDPIGESGGMNLHGFVGNNPISRIDPLGLDPAFAPDIGIFQNLSPAQEVSAAKAVAGPSLLVGLAVVAWPYILADFGLENALLLYGLFASEKLEQALHADCPNNSHVAMAFPNGGVGPKHGGTTHNQRIDDFIKSLPKGAQNIRKAQQQVDVNGNPAGKNFPDVQYDLNGVHYNVEFDMNPLNAIKHFKTIIKNDPVSPVELVF